MVAVMDPIFVESCYVDTTSCAMDVDSKDPQDRVFKAAGVVPIENFLRVLDQKDHLQKDVDNLTKQREADRTRIAGLVAVTENLKHELEDLKKRKSQSENDLRKNVQLARDRADEKIVQLQNEIDDLDEEVEDLKKRESQSKNDHRNTVRLARVRANEKIVQLQDEIDDLYDRMAQSKADRLKNKMNRRAQGL